MIFKKAVPLFMAVVLLGAGVWIGFQIKPASESMTIIDQIKNISELATVAYHVTRMEERDPKPESILYEKVRVLLVWRGWVKAGVDLEKANFDYNEKDKVLMVALPPATILSATPDDGGFKSYVIQNYGTGVGKKPSGTLVAKWAGETTNKLTKEAEDVNITGKALEQAKKTITSLGEALGMTVIFKT